MSRTCRNILSKKNTHKHFCRNLFSSSDTQYGLYRWRWNFFSQGNVYSFCTCQEKLITFFDIIDPYIIYQSMLEFNLYKMEKNNKNNTYCLDSKLLIFHICWKFEFACQKYWHIIYVPAVCHMLMHRVNFFMTFEKHAKSKIISM